MAPTENDLNNVATQILGDFWKRRKLILAFVATVTLFVVLFSYLLPERYRAETTLLPETAQTKKSTLGGLADLAAMAGVGSGEMKLSKLYPTILVSETILSKAIFHRYSVSGGKDTVNLIGFWKLNSGAPERDFELALLEMRERLEPVLDFRTDVVTVSLEMEQADLSQRVLNVLVDAMDEYLRETGKANASEQRKWIESRLRDVTDRLVNGENRLKEFREKNRRVSDSPQLLLEQARLARDVELNSVLYAELRKQQELTRIEEIKNISMVSVLDPARAPTKKSFPKRANMAVTAFGVSFLLALVAIAFWSQFGSAFLQFYRRMKGTRAQPNV